MLLAAFISQTVTAKTIVLDQVSDLKFHQQTRDLLVAAHQAIGNDVVFVNIPLARSYQEIQKGKLSGLVCRVQQVGDAIDNVIKVPEPVGSFDMVLVVDTQQCPKCTEIDDLHHIVSVQGFVALQDFLSSQENPTNNISYLASREKVFEMLQRQRVDGIIVSDVLLPQSLLDQYSNWKVISLKTENVYHYLHSDYAYMVDSLAQQIKSLKSQS